MSSPLDDLRKISNQVAKKKNENLHNIRKKQELERIALSKDSLGKKEKRESQTEQMAKKSKQIKLWILIACLSILGVVMFFSVRSLFFGTQLSDKDVVLLSDGLTVLDTDNPEYNNISTFIKKWINAYKVDSAKTEIPWYHGIPSGRTLKYEQVLTDRLQNNPTFDRVRYNDATGLFQAVFSCQDGEEITFNIVYNEDDDLKIVKIY